LESFLESLTSPFLWGGVLITLEVFVVAAIGGLLCGTAVALLRESRLKPVAGAAWIFVWVIRGAPLLLQLLFLYDVLPQFGIRLSSVVTAMLGLVIFEAANMGEIIRGGLHAVEREQILAGQALGLSPFKIFWIIVIPQALRAIIPPMGTTLISLVKDTSLASVIALDDLLSRAESIASQNFRFLEVLSAALVIYLGLAAVLSVLQQVGERSVDFYRDRGAGAKRQHWMSLFRGHALPGILSLEREPTPPAAKPAETAPAREHRPSSAEGDDRPGGEITIATFLAGKAGKVSTRAGQPAVSCRGVVKRYSEKTVLENVTFELSPGEVVVLMGPSGSGKSTLLRLINHLERLDGGEIRVDGSHVGYKSRNGHLVEERNISAARARANIGMVFQSYNLVRHLSAIDNVCLGAVHARGQARESAVADGLELLRAVGLEHYAERRPHQLSGGQQQRVAIARALATRPHLLLLDEPTSALDPELVGEVQVVLRQLAEIGMTMLLATHDIAFARDVADRVLFMSNGKIVEEGGARELLAAPKNPLTRRFLRLITEQQGS